MRLHFGLYLLVSSLWACPASDSPQATPDTETDHHDGPEDFEIGCDGLDDDGDGRVDEGCGCAPGATQHCYGGTGELAGVGACALGGQVCMAGFEFGEWSSCDGWAAPTSEVCGNGIDDDCDGVDTPCTDREPEPEPEDDVLVLALDIHGDCITASCPPTYPFPVACDLEFDGGDPRGCVASSPRESDVYLQEGDNCGAGRVSGTLTCSRVPGPPLDAATCPIDKEEPTYTNDPRDCVPTHD